MAGTKAGGLKAAAKNKANDPDFYAKIGAIGGKNGTTGGFASDNECECAAYDKSHRIARCAGKLGGTISRRPKVAA